MIDPCDRVYVYATGMSGYLDARLIRPNNRVFRLKVGGVTGERRNAEFARLFTAAIVHPTTRFIATRLNRTPKLTAEMLAPYLVNRNLPDNIILPPGCSEEIDRINGARFVVKPKNPLRMSAYLSYLQTDHWSSLKSEVFERWGRHCINCGSDRQVDGHHLRYRTPLESCTSDDVVPLCRACHERAHYLQKSNPGAMQCVSSAAPGQPMVRALQSVLRSSGRGHTTSGMKE